MLNNLGVSIYCIPDQNLKQLFTFVKDNNFGAIELWDSPLKEPNSKYHNMIEKSKINISVHAPLLDLGDVNSVNLNVNKLKSSIKRAKKWNAKILVLHLGLCSPNTPHGMALNSAESVISRLIPILEENEIIICVENVGYQQSELISDFTLMKDFIDQFPKKYVGVTFDVAHANVTSDIEKGIEIMGNKIKHIHLSDNKGQKNNHHLPIGNGNIDFKLLSKISKGCDAILEIKPSDLWKKTIIKSRDRLKNIGLITENVL